MSNCGQLQHTMCPQCLYPSTYLSGGPVCTWPHTNSESHSLGTCTCLRSELSSQSHTLCSSDGNRMNGKNILNINAITKCKFNLYINLILTRQRRAMFRGSKIIPISQLNTSIASNRPVLLASNILTFIYEAFSLGKPL